jgi:YjbE family integral membrane protein
MPPRCNALRFLMSRHDEACASGSSGAKLLASSKTFDHRLCRTDRSLLCSLAAHEAPFCWIQVQPLNLEPLLMEFLSAPWWSALLAIILIDLVLAGDNAIVIALAARNLPADLQKKAIVWGTVGAIAVRSVMTLFVVWLLQIPGLMLVGGLGLLWIAYKLIADTGDGDDHGPAATTFWGAMKTIVVADALMGVDNVLGVAGAAHGAWDLVILGLLISVPIVVFGSSVVLKLVERFPIIIQLGAAVLAFTAAKMIVGEPLLDALFDAPSQAVWRWATYLVAIVLVLGAGWWTARKAALKAV